MPLALALVRNGYINETRLVELLSVNPAKILGVAGGTLGVGAEADVTVIDPECRFTLHENDIVSKSKNSPFINTELQGKALLTICGGRITHNSIGA